MCSTTDLDEGGVEVDVVRHDDGTDDADGLQNGLIRAGGAAGDEQALHHQFLIGDIYKILSTDQTNPQVGEVD